MLAYRLSVHAQHDVVDILAWTHRRFGEAARQRYAALLIAAMRDIAAQPDRVGSSLRPEIGAGVRSWHLRLSRKRGRTDSGLVQQPRHFVIYRIEQDRVVIGRVLHDSMELSQHLSSRDAWT